MVRIYGLKFGYKAGVNSLIKLQQNGMMAKLMEAVGIIGMMVVGGMVATMLPVVTPIKFSMVGATVKLQTIFNQIMPGLLPLALTLLIFGMIRKKFSISKLTIGLLVVGVLAHVVGIL